MRYFKTTKDYLRIGYYGTLKDLRREAIRLLNAIDMTEDNGGSVDSPHKPERWE